MSIYKIPDGYRLQSMCEYETMMSIFDGCRQLEQHLAAAESGATPAGYRLQPIIEYEAMNKIVEDHSRLEQRLAAAEARIDALLRMQAAVQVVADESDGIAGWHMNGEIAKWEEILPEIFEDHTQIKHEVIDD